MTTKLGELAVWINEKQDAAGVPVTIVARLKHAALLAAAKVLGSQAALARHLEIDPAQMGEWINLKKCPPQEPTKWWTEERLLQLESRLFALTHMSLEELFPESLRANVAFLESPKTFERTIELKRKAMEAYAIATRERFNRIGHDDCEREEMRDAIMNALKGLRFREREILKVRYGLNGETPKNLQECAAIFRISPERVRQIEMKALRRLQHRSRPGGLEEFVSNPIEGAG
jgi:RNA polymerase sigma factor (sigma-70 family)